MKLTIKDVKHVAGLSALPLSSKKIQKFRGQLTEVIDYMSKIQKTDTQGIPQTSQVTNLTNIFREDRIDSRRMLSQATALASAKRSHHGFFMIESVFD